MSQNRHTSTTYVLRKLATKCANSHVIEDRSKILQARQVGVGVAGEAEAAIHATRRYISQLPSGHAFIKLDFANAINILRRSQLLVTMARNIQELYRFTLATYECDQTLIYGTHTIPSRDGPQHGDPLSSLKFCESIQPILNELDSDLEIGSIDDLFISSDLLTLAKDVESSKLRHPQDSSLTPLSVKLSWTISPTSTPFLSSATSFECLRTT